MPVFEVQARREIRNPERPAPRVRWVLGLAVIREVAPFLLITALSIAAGFAGWYLCKRLVYLFKRGLEWLLFSPGRWWS